MRYLFTIGAASIVALTLSLAAGEAQQKSAEQASRSLNDVVLCSTTLNSERSGWQKDPKWSVAVAEATRRGLSITDCRQKLRCSGILASPAMQKFAATALSQTKQEYNTSSLKRGGGEVFESFQQNLMRLIITNVPPPSYAPHVRGREPQLIDHGHYEMQKAAKDMTSDEFTQCFPEAWGLVRTAIAFQTELKRKQEEAAQQARIEAAKPINRLRQAYFSYMVVKKCYDVRLGYQLVYINEVELERARHAVKAIETSALKEDSSIDTGNTWQEGTRTIEASQQHVEQYFCKKTYNDLLSGAPYSPPEKDF